jgi:hypothetical protein
MQRLAWRPRPLNYGRHRPRRRYLKYAHGSCPIEMGDTRCLRASIAIQWRPGPRQRPRWVTAEYSLLPGVHAHAHASRGHPGVALVRRHEIRASRPVTASVVDMGAMGGGMHSHRGLLRHTGDAARGRRPITGAFIAMYDLFPRGAKRAGSRSCGPRLRSGHSVAWRTASACSTGLRETARRGDMNVLL